MNNKELDHTFYKNIAPIKLTEGRKIKLYSEGWGLLTDYYLDSVKINKSKAGTLSSATLRISDRAGQTTCFLRGTSVGLLFGLTNTEWSQVEELCDHRQQLFYRYFKNGISQNFSYEQKLFYNFCLTSQKSDVLVVKFRRSMNMRKQFQSDVFLEILELRKCDNILLDIYVDQLRIHSNETPKN